MPSNHPLGYCPACLHADRDDVGYLDELPDGPQVCDTCRQSYPNAAAVTAARRSLAAEAGWAIRRRKYGPSGRKVIP